MLYFDTSILVPYFVPESTSVAVQKLIDGLIGAQLLMSQWARVEFSAAVTNAACAHALPRHAARAADARFDEIERRSFTLAVTEPSDFDLARTFVQNPLTGLRAPDALHLAIAANRNVATIYTLDAGMLKAGKLLGLPVVRGI